MKLFLSLLITLISFNEIKCQTLTIANLINYSNSMPKPYNESQASNTAIDNFVLTAIQKGFILTSFTNTTQLNGTILKAQSSHSLTNALNNAEPGKNGHKYKYERWQWFYNPLFDRLQHNQFFNVPKMDNRCNNYTRI